jgi:hypothetical protein
MMPIPTLYVIPTGCPKEDMMLVSVAWELGAVKQSIFDILSVGVGYPKKLEVKYNQKTFLSWTCAGCSIGAGNDEIPCPQRKVGLGGRDL